MEAFENPEASHRDIFPVGEPFKCLYAIHALFEYKGLVKYTDQSSRRLLSMPEFPRYSNEQARIQSMSLIVNALSDNTVLNQASERLTMQITAKLVHVFQQWIRGKHILLSLAHFIY
jgi:ubiquitin carboxyl-terminal hydrolase 34